MFIIVTTGKENKKGVTKELALQLLTAQNLNWQKYLRLSNWDLIDKMRVRLSVVMGVELEIVDDEALVCVRVTGEKQGGRVLVIGNRVVYGVDNMPKTMSEFMGAGFKILGDVYYVDDTVEVWYTNGGWDLLCLNSLERRDYEEFWRGGRMIADVDSGELDD